MDRQRGLKTGLKAASLMLLFEGALLTLSATLFPNLGFLRSHPLALPPLALAGPALLALGYFAAKDEGPRVVDALILLAFGRLICLFWNLRQVPEVMASEWVFAGASALWGAWLAACRKAAPAPAPKLEEIKKAPPLPEAPKRVSEAQPFLK